MHKASTSGGSRRGHDKQPYPNLLERLIPGIEPTTCCFWWKALAIAPKLNLQMTQLLLAKKNILFTFISREEIRYPNKLQQKVKNPRKWKCGFSHPCSIRIKFYMLVVPLHMRQSGTTFQTELHFCCPNVTLFFPVSNVQTFHYSRKATSTTSLSITQLKPKKIKTKDHSYLTKRKVENAIYYQPTQTTLILLE